MLDIDKLKSELLSAEKIGVDRLGEAEKAAKERGISITEELASSLVLDFADLGECCSNVTGLPYVPLLPKPPSEIALRLISSTCAAAWEAFPVEYDPGVNTLWFAIHDPAQQTKLERLFRFFMQPQRLGFTIAPDVEIARACRKHFGEFSRADRALVPEQRAKGEPITPASDKKAAVGAGPATPVNSHDGRGRRQKKRSYPVYEEMHRSLVSIITLLVRREHGDAPEGIHKIRTRVRYCQLLAAHRNLDRIQTDGLTLAAWILGLQDGYSFARQISTPYEIEAILAREDTAEKTSHKHRVVRQILGLVQGHEALCKSGGSQSRDVSKVRRALQVNWSAAPDVQDLLESFLQILVDDEFLAKTGGSDGRVLILDPAEETTGALMPSLVRVGYNAVSVAEEAAVAEKLEAFTPDLVIIEMAHEPAATLRLCESLSGPNKAQAVPVLALVPAGDDHLASQSLRAGAHDFLATPINLELLLLKIQACLAGDGPAAIDSGVSGTLDEMTFTDMIQILCAGRKNLEIVLNRDDAEGHVYVSGGEVVHACIGDLTGEDAFYEFMRWGKGRFVTRRCAQFPERSITSSTMSLLMEGARQVDELVEASD